MDTFELTGPGAMEPAHVGRLIDCHYDGGAAAFLQNNRLPE